MTSNFNILIVDDDKISLMLLAARLEERGFNIHCTQSGKDCVTDLFVNILKILSWFEKSNSYAMKSHVQYFQENSDFTPVL